MAKTKRMILENLKLCDVVCEVLDARIPVSSRNPDIHEITAGKPSIIILNRVDQADPSETSKWVSYFRQESSIVIETDSKSGKGVEKLNNAVMSAASEIIQRAAAKGQNKMIRAMILGIPNVGKSSLINRITKSSGAKAEDRPGITRGKQWFSVSKNLELLDTPGILWPKIEDPNTGLMLAFTGAVRDQTMDLEELAMRLFLLMATRYPQALKDRFKIEPEGTGLELLKAAALKRGCIISGGDPDYNRISIIALDEYRAGKLGRITLETVPVK